MEKKTNLTEAHFTRWLMLFQEEAFEHFPAQEAQLITDKATMIADSLYEPINKAFFIYHG